MIRFLAIILCSASLFAADTKRDGIAATKIDGVTSAAKVDGVTISGGGGSSTLNTDLIAYWDMDEASGSALDSETTGTAQDLTDNATVTSAGGKIGTSRQFTAANAEFLSRADSADLSTATDFSFAVWVYLDSKPAGQMAIATKGGATVATREYAIDFNQVSDRFRFIVFDGSGATIVSADNLGSPSLSTWYLIIVTCDLVNNVIGISVNAGTQNTAAFTGTPPDSTGTFTFGTSWGGTAGTYWNGRIDEVGFWKKALTSSEINELYNAGSGKTYPF